MPGIDMGDEEDTASDGENNKKQQNKGVIGDARKSVIQKRGEADLVNEYGM